MSDINFFGWQRTFDEFCVGAQSIKINMKKCHLQGLTNTDAMPRMSYTKEVSKLPLLAKYGREELRKNHRPTFVKNVKSLNRYYRENQSLCSSSNCFECGPLWLHWLVGGAASNFLSNVKFAIQELG